MQECIGLLSNVYEVKIITGLSFFVCVCVCARARMHIQFQAYVQVPTKLLFSYEGI